MRYDSKKKGKKIKNGIMNGLDTKQSIYLEVFSVKEDSENMICQPQLIHIITEYYRYSLKELK